MRTCRKIAPLIYSLLQPANQDGTCDEDLHLWRRRDRRLSRRDAQGGRGGCLADRPRRPSRRHKERRAEAPRRGRREGPRRARAAGLRHHRAEIAPGLGGGGFRHAAARPRYRRGHRAERHSLVVFLRLRRAIRQSAAAERRSRRTAMAEHRAGTRHRLHRLSRDRDRRAGRRQAHLRRPLRARRANAQGDRARAGPRRGLRRRRPQGQGQSRDPQRYLAQAVGQSLLQPDLGADPRDARRRRH